MLKDTRYGYSKNAIISTFLVLHNVGLEESVLYEGLSVRQSLDVKYCVLDKEVMDEMFKKEQYDKLRALYKMSVNAIMAVRGEIDTSEIEACLVAVQDMLKPYPTEDEEIPQPTFDIEIGDGSVLSF